MFKLGICFIDSRSAFSFFYRFNLVWNFWMVSLDLVWFILGHNHSSFLCLHCLKFLTGDLGIRLIDTRSESPFLSIFQRKIFWLVSFEFIWLIPGQNPLSFQFWKCELSDRSKDLFYWYLGRILVFFQFWHCVKCLVWWAWNSFDMLWCSMNFSCAAFARPLNMPA